MKLLEGKLFKKRFRSDWNIRILALVLALLLWFYIRGEQEGEVVFNVPLHFINLPSQYVLVSKSRENISLTLRARQNVIMGLSSEQFRVECDLKSTHSGDNNVSISSQNIIVPQGVRVVGINPSYIKVKLEVPRGN